MTQEVVVGKRFVIQKKIGCGSFGEIYCAVDRRTGEKLAAKAERSDAKHPQLKFENKVYTTIPRVVGFPEVFWFGESGRCNVMVMELLGPSLETLFASCRRKFSLKTVAQLGLQVVERLRHLHEHHYVHRDVKPDNFLIGRQGCKDGTDKIVYCIDLGLCKRYRDGKTLTHIPYRDKKRLTGTPRYASIFTHQGIEQSRRDDLESLGYILVYFCRGVLPWMGMKANTKQEKYDSIGKKKMSTPIAQLCKDLPTQFTSYLTYCRGLKFAESPDYAYLKRLFTDVLNDLGTANDSTFDWETQNSRSPTSSATSSSTSNNHRTTARRYVPCAITKPPVSRRRGTSTAANGASKSKHDPHQTPTPVVNTLQPRHRSSTGGGAPPKVHQPPVIERAKRTEPRVPNAGGGSGGGSGSGAEQYHSPNVRSSGAARKSSTPARKLNPVGKKTSGGRRSRAVSSPAARSKEKPLPEIIDITSSSTKAKASSATPLREKNTNAHQQQKYHPAASSSSHRPASNAHHPNNQQQARLASIPVGLPTNGAGRPATAPTGRSPLRTRGHQAAAHAPSAAAKVAAAEKPKDISEFLKLRNRRNKRQARQRSMTANAVRPSSRVVPTAPVALKSKAAALASTHSSVSSTPSKQQHAHHHAHAHHPPVRSSLSPSRLKDMVAASSSPSARVPTTGGGHGRGGQEPPSSAPHLNKKSKYVSRRPVNPEQLASMHVMSSSSNAGGGLAPSSHPNVPNVQRTLSNTPTLARTATNMTDASGGGGPKNLSSAHQAALSLGRPSSGKSGVTASTSGMVSKSSSMRPMSRSTSIPTPTHANAHHHTHGSSSTRQNMPTTGGPVPMDISQGADVHVSTRSVTPTRGPITGAGGRGSAADAAHSRGSTSGRMPSGGSCASGSSVIGVKRSRTAWTQTEEKRVAADALGGFDATQPPGTEAEREKLLGAYEAMELERDRWKRQYESVSQKLEKMSQERDYYKKLATSNDPRNHHQQQHHLQQPSNTAKRRPLSAATAPPVQRGNGSAYNMRSSRSRATSSGALAPPSGGASSGAVRHHLLSPSLRGNSHQHAHANGTTALPLAKRARVMGGANVGVGTDITPSTLSSSTRRSSSRGSISSAKENLGGGMAANRSSSAAGAGAGAGAANMASPLKKSGGSHMMNVASSSKMPPRRASASSRAMATSPVHHHRPRRKSDVIVL